MADAEQTGPVVVIQTGMGTIKARLWPDRAPDTVASFLRYAEKGHYDGLIFHRVIPGFMIQGGGLSPDMQPRPTAERVRNEASDKTPNRRGTLAMARTSDPHSATSQFFVNLSDNDFLNHTAPTPAGYGYCVFGEVIEGMDVVDRIAQVPTTRLGPHDDVPVKPVLIESIRPEQA